MEHWNEELPEEVEQILNGTFTMTDEELKCAGEVQSATEVSDTRKTSDKKNTYVLTDIYNKLCDEFGGEPKICREKLKEMFQALFGCDMKGVLVKEGRAYKVGEYGRILVESLINIHSTRDGLKIRRGKYNEVNFHIENELLYCIDLFFEEQDMQEGETKKTTDELRGEIRRRFRIGRGTWQLRKSIAQFNMWMKILVNDEESVPIHENASSELFKWLEREKGDLNWANKIDELGGYMLDDIWDEIF